MHEQSLGRFTLVRELGRGGMGVVYLATDDSLGRSVAIKMLPEAMSSDRDRLARLEREAKTLASVSHPSVATIFALEERDDGSRFLVLEYVDGQSLGDIIRDGPLPLKKALRYGRQMAEALVAAHRQGVVHRDFKPSNVMITAGDRVKVLDFGLAKSHLMGPEAMPTEAPTLTAFNTQPGVILGTPGYMSPEQARGLEVDHRTDVFSFGCVLFACLTGSGPFGGETPSDAMAEMLTSEPAWSKLPEGTPTRLLELLIRLLTKGREQRIGEMSAALEIIDEILDQFGTMASSASASMLAPPSNIPVSITSFVGRDQVLEELRALWSSARMLTLTGSGGCGKSRLASRFLEEAYLDTADGVYFVNVGSLTSGELVQQAVLSVLGLKEEQNKTALGTVVDHLRSKELILFLDNCEHLIDDVAAVVDEVLHQCPGVKVFVTSRQSIGNAGEQVYHVPSLGVPTDTTAIAAEQARGFESVRLFVDRSVTASPRFKLTDDNAPTVAQICRQLDGIPLAIELAAARVRAMPVGQVARRLDDSFRLLRGGSKTALERHQTLQATIDWSYSMLTVEEQILLRRLSAFSGGWSLEGAEAVGAGEHIEELDVLDYLSQLVEKSLVAYEEKDGVARYRLLETMRQYATAKLVETPEAVEVRDRHVRHYVELAEMAEPELRGSVEWIQRLAIEMDNIFAAVNWAMSSGRDATPALRLVAAAWRFWEIRGLYLTATTLLREAVAKADESTDQRTLRRALYGLGALEIRQGAFTECEATFNRCSAISEAANDTEGVGLAANGLGILTMNTGDLDASQKHFEAALAAFRSLNDPAGSAMALGNLGELHLMRGDLEAARPMMEESVELARKHRTFAAYMMPDHLRVVARLCIQTKRIPEAIKHLRECFALIREFQSALDTAYSLEAISELAIAIAEAADAPTARSVMEFAASGEGSADGLRRRIGSPVPPAEKDERTSIIQQVREALEPSEFQRLFDAGRSLSLAGAIGSAIVFLGSLDLTAPEIKVRKVEPGAAKEHA
ncbi:MAG: protein kinase [Phycisphaeraceae bacterium]|nr:protein kinase [Phycisphaeraceae bacterium]MCB9847477.1 protein kinase [Phycisphaeraceae bacterium]